MKQVNNIKKKNQESSGSCFYAGLSGLQLPVPKYLFPPSFQDTSRLTYYASLFNSIEINSSFYKIPRAATVAKWAASVKENFKFTFKLWKEITHSKGFNFRDKDVEQFLKAINAVGEKKGCLLMQFPPSLGKEYIVQLNILLSCIREIEPVHWDIAIEFRNKSWYNKSTYNLLKFFKAALVIQDIPKSATPMINHEADFIYIRFHGPTGNYRESYSDDFLGEYAGYINEGLTEGKTVYTYFNNTLGDAFKNLVFLNKLMHERPIFQEIHIPANAGTYF